MASPLGALFGPTESEEDLRRFSTAGFGSQEFQKFLPFALRNRQTRDILMAGIRGIGELIRRPGGLSPTVSQAILPRLAAESESIGQNFRGIAAEQAGGAARSNLPTSIKNALSAALNVSQERAQRGARREALVESEALRRQDLQQTFDILNSILQFTSSGRGQAIQGLGAAAQSEAAQSGALLSLIGSLFGSAGLAGGFGKLFGLAGGAAAGIGGAAGAGGFAGGAGSIALTSGSRFKERIARVSEDDILHAVRALPVYEWSYKGEATRHIGPMAEDFEAALGVGGNPDVIHIIDAIGALMASTRALARKVETLEAAA